MEFCSGSDLSVYIKNRGRLPTLDYVPRGSLDNDKIFYPHPPSGGIAERVTRSFLGQLGRVMARSITDSSTRARVSPSTEFDTSGYQTTGELKLR